jgi:hypothetical protein
MPYPDQQKCSFWNSCQAIWWQTWFFSLVNATKESCQLCLGTVGLNDSQVIIGQVHNMVGEKNETSIGHNSETRQEMYIQQHTEAHSKPCFLFACGWSCHLIYCGHFCYWSQLCMHYRLLWCVCIFLSRIYHLYVCIDFASCKTVRRNKADYYWQ